MSAQFTLYYYDNTGTLASYDLGTVYGTTPGVPYFVFSIPEGIIFRQVKIVASLYSGSTDDNITPIIEFISLRYARTLDALFGYSARIDCSKSYKGRSVNEQINALFTLAQSKNLLSFAWRDAGEQRDVYVRIIQMSGQGSTGRGPEQVFDVVLNEMSAD